MRRENTIFKIKGYLPRAVVRAAVKILKNYDGNIADIGCGTGELLKGLGKDKKRNIVGLDIALDQATKARQSGLTVVMGDALFTPFKDKVFDAVACLNTIYNFHSLDELRPAFKEVARILTKNGRVVLDIRNKKNLFLQFKYWLHMRKHKFPTVTYLPEELEKAMKSFGLRLVRKDAIGMKNPLLSWGYIMVFEKGVALK